MLYKIVVCRRNALILEEKETENISSIKCSFKCECNWLHEVLVGLAKIILLSAMFEFSYDEFPLGNTMLISCKKDLTSHFILDPYSSFHYYLRRHFSFLNDYISLIYPYQAIVIKCRGCYRKSLRNIMKSFPVYLK